MPKHRFEGETIHITNLRVEGIIGVRPSERERPQPLIISLSFPGDFSAAAEVDTLEHTTDYSEVAREVREYVQGSRFRLLEALARGLAAHLGERFGLARLTLEIRKPDAVAGSDGPAVSLSLVREGGP